MRNFFFSRKKNYEDDPGKAIEMDVFCEERGLLNKGNQLTDQPWAILIAIFLRLYDRADPLNFFTEIRNVRLVCYRFKNMHIDFFKKICEFDHIRNLFFPPNFDLPSYDLSTHEKKSQRILIEMENFKKYERRYLARLDGFKKISQLDLSWYDLAFVLLDREQFMFVGIALEIKKPDASPLAIAGYLHELYKIDRSFFDFDLQQLLHYDLDVAHGILSHINYLLKGITQHASFLVFMSLLIAGDCAIIFNSYLNYQKLHIEEQEFQRYLSYYYFLAIYNDSADIVCILAKQGVDLGKKLPAYYPEVVPYAIAHEIADQYVSLPENDVIVKLLNDPVMFCLYFKSKRVLKYLIESNVKLYEGHSKFAKKYAPELLYLVDSRSNHSKEIAVYLRPLT